MGHVILLGDSIFDNAAYVRGGPDVVKQVREVLPFGWKATLLAQDGATTRDLPRQISRIPSDATHLVLSIGGNDALGASHILGQSVGRVAEAVSLLETVQARFASAYRAAAGAVLERGLPTALCTIYDTPPSEPDQRIIRTALAVFNDIITRTAFSRGVPLIDLRLICNEDGDYANPIEPSVQGGAKMAAAIAEFVSGTNNGVSRSTVIAGPG